MTTTIDYSKIDQNRPASWKQKKGINTRLSDLISKKLKVDISAVRPVVGEFVTNKPDFNHGQVQKYFQITKISQVDKALIAAAKEAIENSKAKKARPKKQAGKKSEAGNSSVDLEKFMQFILEENDKLLKGQAEINERLDSL